MEMTSPLTLSLKKMLTGLQWGEANRGICCGLSSITRSALRLSGSLCGSSQGSQSSLSIDRGLTSQQVVTQPISPNLIRHLEVIEELC